MWIPGKSSSEWFPATGRFPILLPNPHITFLQAKRQPLSLGNTKVRKDIGSGRIEDLRGEITGQTSRGGRRIGVSIAFQMVEIPLDTLFHGQGFFMVPDGSLKVSLIVGFDGFPVVTDDILTESFDNRGEFRAFHGYRPFPFYRWIRRGGFVCNESGGIERRLDGKFTKRLLRL